MDQRDKIDRRRFVLGTLPACAGACVAFRAASTLVTAQSTSGQQQPTAPVRKFDSELPRKITYREAFALTYGRAYIPLVLFLTKRMGRDAALDLLKASATEMAAEQAALAVKQVGGRDFAAFKRVLTSPAVENFWSREVVEDSDSVHELRVTECLWAATFRAANAADEGYASVCHGDYAFASAFNPQLSMVRDRTLMQGHPYCNHRYSWKKGEPA